VCFGWAGGRGAAVTGRAERAALLCQSWASESLLVRANALTACCPPLPRQSIAPSADTAASDRARTLEVCRSIITASAPAIHHPPPCSPCPPLGPPLEQGQRRHRARPRTGVCGLRASPAAFAALAMRRRKKRPKKRKFRRLQVSNLNRPRTGAPRLILGSRTRGKPCPDPKFWGIIILAAFFARISPRKGLACGARHGGESRLVVLLADQTHAKRPQLPCWCRQHRSERL
jgi:hypothetical protein